MQVTGFCPKCGTPRTEGMTFCGRCGHDFATASLPSFVVPDAPAKAPASFGRLVVTPILTTLVGYLIFGMYGLALGAVVGILYILVASRK